MLRAINRQGQHVHTLGERPEPIRRIVPVVAPDQRLDAAGLDHVGDHVHVADIVGRTGLGSELGQRIGPWVPTRRHAGVLVSIAGDLEIGELEAAHHTVQHHGRDRATERIMIEMGVRRHRDVDLCLRKLVLEPQAPRAGGVIAPRIEQHGRAARRGDLDRAMPEEVDADGAIGKARRLLHFDH